MNKKDQKSDTKATDFLAKPQKKEILRRKLR